MIIVDLNILLYAINEDATPHEAFHAWWVDTLSGDESVGLPWVVLLGFLRLATNARVFPKPLSTTQAWERIDAWLSLPIVHIPTEKEDHWRIFRELLAATGSAGNLTTDAHLAALALTRGAVLVSCDNDFARFPALRYRNPLSA